MSVRRWIGAVLQRLALFTFAGLVVVLLLHVHAGVIPAGSAGAPGFSTAQWLTSSGEYLTQVARGDLGILQPLKVTGYMREQPMAAELRSRAPASLLLLLLSLVVSLGLGTLLGLLSSRFKAGWLRTPTLLGSLLLLSTPDILVVMALRMLVIWVLSTFGFKLFALTALGSTLTPSHFVAPTLALSALPLAMVARLSAVAFDEVYDQLYIRTAQAKGVTPLRLITRHALKNAWIRVAEAGPLVMSALVTGLVVVEYILFFPGVGRTLGLILEKGGQPAASAGIALLLLLVAVLLDTGFVLIRLALDPRLGGQESRAGIVGFAGRLAGVRELAEEIVRLPGELAVRLTELPAKLVETAWAWRPGRVVRSLIGNPPLLIGLTGVVLLAVVGLFGGRFLDLATANHMPRYIVADGEVHFPPYRPGIPGYPLGSDMAGRDVLVRMVIGARHTLFFTLAVTPVRFLIALPWGLAAGLAGGVWRLASRLLGLTFAAVPVLLIPAALLPVVPVLGGTTGGAGSFWLITAILAAAGIPRLVENIRQHAEAVAVHPFIEGAQAVGAGRGRIFWCHVFPHMVPQLLVMAAADMAWTLLLLAQFGVFSIFLAGSVTVMTGYEVLGNSRVIPLPRIPDWSSMLSRPYEVIFRAPWSLWLPAIAFLLAIIALNLVAEGLRRRAQALQSTPSLEEAGSGRRRLLLEWGAAVVLVVMLSGVVGRYGGQSPALAFGQRAETPLEQARLQLRAVLEQAAGSGPDVERSMALGTLPRVVTAYLAELKQAGLPLSAIETDSRGRMTVLDGSPYRIINAYIPGAPNQVPSYVYFVNRETGTLVGWITTREKVNSFAVLPGPWGPDGVTGDWVILAGPMPSHDYRWGLSVWGADRVERGYASFGKGAGVWDLHRRQKDELDISLIQANLARAEWVVTRDSQSPIEVLPDGAVTVCRDRGTICATFDWVGGGWAGSRRR